MSMKRGQGAMEYLMTYGWAILVVMIVGIVMWQLGIFHMGATTLTSVGFGAVKPQLAGTGLNHDGAFTGVFMNGAGAPMTYVSVTANLTTPSPAGCGTSTTISPSAPISAGSNFRLEGLDCSSGTIGSVGDPYTLSVSITYNVTVGGVEVQRISSGELRGPLE